MAETLNMMSITIEQFVNELKMDLEDGNYSPMVGIGLSGIGKTMAIHEVTKQLGIGFCELRLVALTETDILGVPTIEGGKTTWASNELLPYVSRDGQKGVLVLDEITSASKTVRAVVYQLMDSKRRLSNYELPTEWKVVALGNGPSDGGVYTGMEAAFLSRATCYRIEPDLSCWVKWATSHGVNPTVIAFLQFMPDMLHVFDPDEIASIFPCPRSWTALSDRLNSREKRTQNGILSIDAVEIYAAGAVGVEAAPKFSAFYAYNNEAISAEDVLSGKVLSSDYGFNVGKISTQVMYITIQNIIKALNDELSKQGSGNATSKDSSSWFLSGDQGAVSSSPEGKYSMQMLQRVANVCRFFIKISELRLDYGMTGINELMNSSDKFADIVINDTRFDELYPEFIQWCVDNAVIGE